jgi:transposase-like protein
MNVRDLHESGLTIAEAATYLGISKEAVRSRARRQGIAWVGRDEVYSPFDAKSEAERLSELKQAERQLVRALALAFSRGEHLTASGAVAPMADAA